MVFNPNATVGKKNGVICQVCGENGLESLLDLGYQPLCNEYLPGDEAPSSRAFYPLCVYYCEKCSLAQLGYVIPTKDTFGEQYTYLTGSSRSLINYYDDLAEQLTQRFDLDLGDVVVEIGSNDGTLLKSLQKRGLNPLGIEGSPQAAAISINNGIPTINRFFGTGSAKEVKNRLPEGSKIKLVIAMNVLAHTDNINQFLSEVNELMEEETVFISSCHWLIALIRSFEFDTIYHEHLRYYTMHSLMGVFRPHGLHMFDGELTDFYGGSILGYSKLQSLPPTERLTNILEQEKKVNVPEALTGMKNTLTKNKSLLLTMLVDMKESGKRVIGIGAPMKASTLLNFYGITPDLVEYIAEVNELKVGTLVPGVQIPVIHEDAVFEDPPDYAILLSWNMAGPIIQNYRANGYKGKFIMPVPEPEVIDD